MNGQAFIGCKISLISRAGIRYEGILYTIDANNSTVALSKVKSFGTEDRYAETPVPQRDEIYEYIIFRGSDIQDLHVCEAPKKQPQIMAQDPAILEITGKPPIPAPFSRRRVQFTSRPYQGDARDAPFVDDIKNGLYYQPHSEEEMYESWPERTPSRSYYSRNRSYYQPNSYGIRNQPSYYPDMSRYNNSTIGNNNGGLSNNAMMRRRSNTYLSNPNGNVRNKMPSVPSQPRRKNATLRRNTRRSSSLNIRPIKQSENGQETSRASSGNSRSTNMSGRPDSQNDINFKYDKEYDFESANAEIAKELERLTLEKNSVSTATGATNANSTNNSEMIQPLDTTTKKGPTGDSECDENNPTAENQLMLENEQNNSLNLSNNGSVNAGNDMLLTNGPMAKDNGDNVINYDRTKSFYDNISSEATDRAKGKMIRAINWRDERKLNVETFGFNLNGINPTNRQITRRSLIENANSINASNSANRNLHNLNNLPTNQFYKQDLLRYHTNNTSASMNQQQPPPPLPGSYYHHHHHHHPSFDMHVNNVPNKYYYQSRWFSRRPDYRIPSYIQAWN